MTVRSFPSQPGQAEAGLSIVVPVFNEGAGLASFHKQLVEVARQLRQQRGLATEVIYVDDGCRDDSLAVARAAAGRGGRRPGGVAVAQFRQGGGAGGRARSCAHRRRAVHGRRRPASAGIDPDAGRRTGSTAATTSSSPPRPHRANEPRLRRFGVRMFYRLINWNTKAPIPEDAGDFRLLSPRAADGAAADAGAQPLLQGAGELDRLSPVPRRLRAGAAQRMAPRAGARTG